MKKNSCAWWNSVLERNKNPKEFKEIWKNVRLILKDTDGKQQCWFYPGGWGIFEKEGTIEKACVEIEYWGFSVHFGLGFQENSIYTLHFVLVEILQNGAKFRQKVTSGFKNHEEFGKLQPTSGKSKKLKFDGILLSRKYICPKNTFFQLKLYTQSRIYLKLLSTTCVKIHQISYVIFETISHYSRHNLYVLF